MIAARKAHAQHNRAACDALISLKKYDDWVVTTAFYSALHFVNHDIFPLKQGGKTFHSFNGYYYSLSSKTRDCKHVETIKLVARIRPSIGRDYKALHDMCRTARYKDYNITKTDAATARAYLRKIESKIK